MYSQRDLKLWKSKMAAGRMAYDSGLFAQAAVQFRKALHLLEEKQLPAELLSRTLLDLGKTLGSCGQFQEGEDLLKKVLSLDEQEDAENLLIIEDYHQLSLLYWRALKLEPAMAALEQAFNRLAKTEETLPDELKAKLIKHRAVLETLSGNYRAALKSIDEAIVTIGQSIQLGKFSALYGDALMFKSMILVECDRFDEARELYPEAMKVLDLTRGETHVKTLEFLDALLELARKKGLEREEAYLRKEAERVRSMLKRKGAY